MSEISSQQFPEAAAKPKAWLVQIRDTGFLSTADIATTNSANAASVANKVTLTSGVVSLWIGLALTSYALVLGLIEGLHILCEVARLAFFLLTIGGELWKCSKPTSSHSVIEPDWFLLVGIALVIYALVWRFRQKRASKPAAPPPSGWKPFSVRLEDGKSRTIFLEPNSNWPSTPCFAYLASRKSSGSVTIADVLNDMARRADSMALDIECSHVRDFILKQTIRGSVYRIVNRTYGHIDLVAYFERKNEIALAVVCVRHSQSFDTYSTTALKWFQSCLPKLAAIY